MSPKTTPAAMSISLPVLAWWPVGVIETGPERSTAAPGAAGWAGVAAMTVGVADSLTKRPKHREGQARDASPLY